ncbi:uncharacterized protein C8R40DRAFT_1069441 [Lentinula edodes]|uniref:uncharacterized protein n=1 Tax=Lentinula edodes TaxID=5353 RepID=UPI001E8EACD0|nr:uncharacterized protein C8R40DRAFT_1069441 [Lentinula edodes]KAH7875424.1 hypothetical protein C8R40DRAFT_1069441 [Lentinula edodes]
MFPPMSSTHWLEIGFYSRFSLPPSMAKITLTRPTTTRRLSTWEVPLAKSAASNFACEGPAGEVFKVDSSAALCVQETRDVLAVNPFHEAELENSEYPLADSDSECDAEFRDVFYAYEPEFDASLDDDVLQSWNMSRNILAIDSTTPWLTPHIVITPASDTMSDLAIAWFNQPNYYQDTSKLCLPPSDFAENPSFSRSDAPPIITSFLPLAFHPISVFSPSKFNAMIEGCSHERLSYFNVVIALRRQIMKAVAIMANQAANSFRERYDSALPFSNIDRPFSWTDPAEPILSASRFYRATLILDSTNPFRVPHIIWTSRRRPCAALPDILCQLLGHASIPNDGFVTTITFLQHHSSPTLGRVDNGDAYIVAGATTTGGVSILDRVGGGRKLTLLANNEDVQNRTSLVSLPSS